MTPVGAATPERGRASARRRARCVPALLLVVAACGGASAPERGVDRENPPGADAWVLAPVVEGGDAARGRAEVQRYGCGFCHAIRGVEGAVGTAGPPLMDFANRRYIGGVVANEPANLVRWLADPQSVKPGTAMPALGIDEARARDIAAYLYAAGGDSPVHPPSALPLRWLHRLRGGKDAR